MKTIIVFTNGKSKNIVETEICSNLNSSRKPVSLDAFIPFCHPNLILENLVEFPREKQRVRKVFSFLGKGGPEKLFEEEKKD